MILRDYQQSIYDQIICSNTDDLFQLDTGGGKTPIIAKLSIGKAVVIICHRNFLVEQISQTLNTELYILDRKVNVVMEVNF